MQRIENEAKELIADEVMRACGADGTVEFKNNDAESVRAVVSYRSKKHVIYFSRRSQKDSRSSLNSIKGDVRQALRSMGALDPSERALPSHGARRRAEPPSQPDHNLINQVFGSSEKRMGPLGSKLVEAAKRVAPPPVEAQPEVDFGPLMPSIPNPPASRKPGDVMTSLANGKHENAIELTPPPALESGGRTKVQLSQDQAIDIAMHMMRNGTVGRSDTGEPTYTYNEGWSDERVRDAVRADAKVAKVADIRREKFGFTPDELAQKRKKAQPTIASLQAENEELRARLDDMTRRLEAVEAVTKQLA